MGVFTTIHVRIQTYNIYISFSQIPIYFKLCIPLLPLSFNHSTIIVCHELVCTLQCIGNQRSFRQALNALGIAALLLQLGNLLAKLTPV